MKRWSKIKAQLNLINDPSLDFQIHCSAYRMKSQHGSTDLPRYWITLGKNIIFDYPKQFLNQEIELPEEWNRKDNNTLGDFYPYRNDVSSISELIREYIDTPVKELLDKKFESDAWGLTDILKAADKRMGIKRLVDKFKYAESEAVKAILLKRMGKGEK